MPFNEDALLLAICFFVPGFIIRRMECMLAARPSAEISKDWLAFLIWSLVNDCLFYRLILFIGHSEYIKNSPILSAFLWFIIIFIGPIIIGILLSLNYTRSWSQTFFNKRGFSAVHIIPSAWDWKFSRSQRIAHWVIVTLNDDSIIAGIFGEKSFASSDHKERDIYIEQVYTIGAGNWNKADDNKGILILSKEIKSIEFIPIDEGKEND